MIKINEIYLGDCLEIMELIPDKFIDMVLCDLPYGVTQNKHDSLIDLDKLWKQYNRIVKDNGVIVLFGQDKFTAKVMLSNEKNHKYNLIWKKGERTSGFLNAKKQPLRNHEDIMIFYRKQCTYNPQMILGEKAHSRGTKGKLINNNYGEYNFMPGETSNGEWKYPKSILNFDRPHPPIHPTQKPVKLCEWLIKTYSNDGDIILDNTMGIGTTCIAAKNTGRNFIGIELNEEYFNIAKKELFM